MSDDLLGIHRAIAQGLAAAENPEDAALALLDAVAAAGQWSFGAMWQVDKPGRTLACIAALARGGDEVSAFAAACRGITFARGEGLPGRVWESQRAAFIPDIATASNFPRRTHAEKAGLRSALAVPVFEDGEVGAVLELMSPQRDAMEPVAVELMQDIASYLALFLARHRAERAGKAADAARAAMLRASLDGVVAIDDRGFILEFSPAAEVMFGYSRSEMVGTKLMDRLIPPDLRAAHAAGFSHHIQTGEARILGRRIETRALGADGNEFPVELAVIRAEGPTGPIFTAYVRDIADRKKAEEELKGHASLLARQHEEKDRFLALLAHELRNPLAAISNAALLLRKAQPTPDVVERVQAVVERQASNLSRLIDDLLDVSRISRGVVTLRPETLRVGDVVSEAVDVSEPHMRQAEHRLEVDVPDPGLQLMADRVRVVQMLSNLLNNAAKYTPPNGRIRLEASRGAGNVVFQVWDSGVGIDPELMPRIFDMFVRGEHEYARAYSGLGVGLALVKALAEMHGGSITASSAGPGTGSQFTLSLPVGGPAP